MSRRKTVDGDVPLSVLRYLRRTKVDEESRQESRQREKVVPPVSAYRWWARRTFAVTGGILEAYRRAGGMGGLVVDPFAGGGMVPIAALLHGFRCYAQDINAWAAEGLATTLRLPPADAIHSAFEALKTDCEPLLEQAYATKMSTGELAVESHMLRVARALCPCCGTERRLFPHSLVSLKARRDVAWRGAFLACRAGHLFETEDSGVQSCPDCGERVDPSKDYLVGRRSSCYSCGRTSSLEELLSAGPIEWSPVLIQRVAKGRRELGAPSREECERGDGGHFGRMRDLGPVPDGVETKVLRRYGFTTWGTLYPARQQGVLGEIISAVDRLDAPETVKGALRLAAYGVAETAGHVSRWDRWYLKNFESMALHRFNFTTLSAEPNVWGAFGYGRGTFSQRVRLLTIASGWLRKRVGKEVVVEGPLPSTNRRSKMKLKVDARVVLGSSERILLPDSSVSLVLTDPPYHDDVQYSELSLPLKAWAGLPTHDGFEDAAINSVLGNGAKEGSYRRLLGRLLKEVHRVLLPEGRLIFSFANKEPAAWVALLGALQDTGFFSVGYQVVHSENETGFWKQGRATCDFDLLMELAPSEERRDRYVPRLRNDNDESLFLKAVGRQFMEIGFLPEGWEAPFRRHLSTFSFSYGTGSRS